MQGVDYTTLIAVCNQLKNQWIPARVEQIYQRDRYTLLIALRTVNRRGWLLMSWHPQAARLCLAEAPPRTPDTFTFSDQLRHQLNGLALVSLDLAAPWERVVKLQFSKRPQDPVQWCLWVEVMNKYSNVILTNAEQIIVTAAHQVGTNQSRLRSVQTGDYYSLPPKRLSASPQLDEPLEHWRDQMQLIPKPAIRALTQTYSGLSTALATDLMVLAHLPIEAHTSDLDPADWAQLFEQWQHWLRSLQNGHFTPVLTAGGYSVLGVQPQREMETVSDLLCHYYENRLAVQAFQQLHHQLLQCVAGQLKKLQKKAAQFETQLQQSTQAETYRAQADLLMAHLPQWKPGMETITVTDFDTGEPVTLALNPEYSAVQNAQQLYKRHQKLKRSTDFVQPLLAEVKAEMAYLEQVDDAIAVVTTYSAPVDLTTLQEIRDELVDQGYLKGDPHQRSSQINYQYRQLTTPNQFTVLVGRNNNQNDRLTFKTAGSYDLWFHAQEISGSHVLLRLDAGANVESDDLQFCADLAAYFSRARQSEQVPVVFTKPKHVFKPKGAKPGMAVYTHETVLWGQPGRVALEIGA